MSSGRADRLVDKDAADVLRLMQGSAARDVGVRLAELTRDKSAGTAVIAAIGYLDELFGRRGRPGIQMATRATRLAVPQQRVETLCTAYTGALLNAVRSA